MSSTEQLHFPLGRKEVRKANRNNIRGLLIAVHQNELLMHNSLIDYGFGAVSSSCSAADYRYTVAPPLPYFAYT